MKTRYLRGSIYQAILLLHIDNSIKMRCAVVSCKSDNQSKKTPCKNIKFFHFPKDLNLRKKWLDATKRKDKVNIKTAVVCSKHFCESDYKVNLKYILLNYTPKNYRGLKDDAIPKQNLFQSQVSVASLPTSRQMGKLRNEKKKRNQIVNEILNTKDMEEDMPEIINRVEDGDENNTGENIDYTMVVKSCSTSI